MTLKCPHCGKALHTRLWILNCECGWSDPTAYKPVAKACRFASSTISY